MQKGLTLAQWTALCINQYPEAYSCSSPEICKQEEGEGETQIYKFTLIHNSAQLPIHSAVYNGNSSKNQTQNKHGNWKLQTWKWGKDTSTPKSKERNKKKPPKKQCNLDRAYSAQRDTLWRTLKGNIKSEYKNPQHTGFALNWGNLKTYGCEERSTHLQAKAQRSCMFW